MLEVPRLYTELVRVARFPAPVERG